MASCGYFQFSVKRIQNLAARSLVLLLLAAFCLPGVSRAEQWGELRYVETVVNIRKARTTDSLIALKLLPGQAVRVDFLENGWYAVFPPDEAVRAESKAIGYAYAPLLKPFLLTSSPLPASSPVPAADSRAKSGTKAEAAAASMAGKGTGKTFALSPPAGEPSKAVVDEAVKPLPKKIKVLAPVPAVKSKSRVATRKETVIKGLYEIVGQETKRRRKDLSIVINVQTLPEDKDLRKTADLVWNRERSGADEMVLRIYLPGMDPNGLSYGSARYYKDGLSEFWTRKSILFGTGWGTP